MKKRNPGLAVVWLLTVAGATVLAAWLAWSVTAVYYPEARYGPAVHAINPAGIILDIPIGMIWALVVFFSAISIRASLRKVR